MIILMYLSSFIVSIVAELDNKSANNVRYTRYVTRRITSYNITKSCRKFHAIRYNETVPHLRKYFAGILKTHFWLEI